MTYDAATDNYFVKTTRISDNFLEPVDAIMIGNQIYIIEYGGKQGNIWKVTMPAAKNVAAKKETKKKTVS